jgi:hypothetical protein
LLDPVPEDGELTRVMKEELSQPLRRPEDADETLGTIRIVQDRFDVTRGRAQEVAQPGKGLIGIGGVREQWKQLLHRVLRRELGNEGRRAPEEGEPVASKRCETATRT